MKRDSFEATSCYPKIYSNQGMLLCALIQNPTVVNEIILRAKKNLN